MAGSFSGHLVDSFLSAQRQSRGPFGQHAPVTPEIATCGAMAFAANMHGTFPGSMPSSSACVDPMFMDLSTETAKKIAELQAKLNKKLGPEYISQRPGPGGGPKLTYAEGWKVINLANEVFGFNGWSSNIVNLSTDFIDYNEETRRYTVGVTAIVRVTLRDGVFHEDVGYGMLENAKSKGSALDKCKKESVTDGVKRALRNFGNLLGNCLYDKHYTQEVIKIKVPPPKFDKSDLHRRPEFDENRNNPESSARSAPPPASVPPHNPSRAPSTNVNPPPQPPPQTMAAPAIPPHMRAPSGSAATSNSTNLAKPFEDPGQPGPSRPQASSTGAPSKPIVNTGAHAQSSSGTMYRQSGPQPPPAQTASAASAPPPSDKRVTFAPPPQVALTSVPMRTSPPVAEPKHEYVEDESFGMYSEDDEFFASIDLGEGLGGPIDFEEGTGGISSVEDDGTSVLGGYQVPRPQPVAQVSRQEPALGASGRQAQVPASNVPTNPQKPVQQTTPSAGHPSRGRMSSQAGGFHFPSNTNAKPGAALGVKRPADAMREPARRPAQGMGLSHVSANPGPREPLAALDIRDGGDIKRMRR